MSWLKLSLQASAAQLEATETLLSELGAEALTVVPQDDAIPWEPKPGELPVAPRNRVEALVPLEREIEGLRAKLAQGLHEDQLRSLDASFVGDEDWQRRVQAHAVSACFGDRLWLLPKSAPIPDGPCVRLDPGLAFGTGAHPTTRLCLQALATAQLGNADVLDYGCGSGILAIAALKLGARSGFAVDYDPQALVASADNANYNGIRCKVQQLGGEAQGAATGKIQAPACVEVGAIKDDSALLQICLPQGLGEGQLFDLVVANILANPLIELAPRLQRALRPGGRLLLAGLLAEQADQVASAYEQIDFEPLVPAQRDGEWRLLAGWRK